MSSVDPIEAARPDLSGADLPAALFEDPPLQSAPARTLAQAIPSHGLNLNAVLYQAAGSGPHPTMLLLHGLPGNEQNIDIAQSVRRAGWNVLTIHYRGSWGGPGTFSFAHCMEDALATLDWVRRAAGDPAQRIDPERLLVCGHSMGGFVAAHLAAGRPDILAAGLISGVDLGAAFGGVDRDAVTAVDDNVGTSAGLHILAGTSPGSLAREAAANAEAWSLTNYAPALVDRPVLLVTSDDGFAAGSHALGERIEALDGKLLTRKHLATDHSYSDHRIRLQAIVLRWLATI